MIANGTIIGSERILREMRENEHKTAQSVAAMAVALQWHVATNASEPVALATSRSSETGVGEKDVFLVVCDTPQGQGDDARTAAELARSILDAYHEHESQVAAPNGQSAQNGQNGSHSPGNRADVAQWLANAITTGLRRTTQPVGLSAASTPSAQSSQLDRPAAIPATPAVFSVVGAVLHHDTLYVARYGGGQAYLLRNGVLQHLTDTAFAAGANPALLEPDLGQLDLYGEDRVVLCNEAFGTAISETQMRSVLRATPSSRRATQTLLDAAVRDHEGKTFSLALADYVTGRPGVFPNTPSAKANGSGASGLRRGTFRSIAAIVALLVLIAGAIFTVSSLSGSRIFSSGSGGNTTPVGTVAPTVVPTIAPTLNAVVPVSPTATVEPTVTTAPSVIATATQTAEPSATAMPTNTPEPTATNTPEPTPTLRPTRRPTRRPPTATPVPTDTPIPPTPTLVPMDTPTPQPPPPSGGGGGGQPQPTPPICPPGATC